MLQHEIDLQLVKAILPNHYKLTHCEKDGWIRCQSEKGIRLNPYKNLSTGKTITDAEDEELWGYVMGALQNHFGDRLQEVYHNTCFCHVDFVVYFTNKWIKVETRFPKNSGLVDVILETGQQVTRQFLKYCTDNEHKGFITVTPVIEWKPIIKELA